MCWCWFNSGVCCNEEKIVLTKDEIDNAVKDKKHKHFEKGFQLGFEFEEYKGKISKNNNNNSKIINKNGDKKKK